MTPINRAFTINLDSPSTSESNMFAMPGVIFDTTSTGIVLAKVYGPLNEAAIPLRKAIPVQNGQTSVTAAKDSLTLLEPLFPLLNTVRNYRNKKRNTK
jgi:hypothetical protein